MREKIEQKIDEIVNSIIAKDPSEISYSEYRILDCRAKDLRYAEEQQKRNDDFVKIMASTLGGFGSCGSSLPEPEIKED